MPFTDLEVYAEVVWDNRRKYGIADMAQAALGFIFKVSMATDAPEERVLEVFRKAEDGCYASDVVRNPVPMRAHLTINGREVHVQKVGGEVPEVNKDAWYRG